MRSVNTLLPPSISPLLRLSTHCFRITRHSSAARGGVDGPGASSFETFRYIVLPNIATALLAGGMLAFALSFDEVIAALLVIAMTFVPILLAHRLTADRPEAGRTL